MIYAPAPFETLAAQRYRVILADPATDFNSGRGARHPTAHYPIMTDAEIDALPVRALAHPEGARVMMWTTGPRLQKAFITLSAWGFRYSTTRVWGKLKSGREEFGGPEDMAQGMGLEVIDDAEFLIIGKIGAPQPAMGRKPRRLFFGERREHSRKPESLYEEIEDLYRGPLLELFARRQRFGWSTWGDQETMFNP